MKIEIDVPDYSSEGGMRMEWENGFTILVQVQGGTIHIQANRAGLVSLARHLLTLAQSEVPLGHHMHFDDSNSLEDGSSEMIIEKIQ